MYFWRSLEIIKLSPGNENDNGNNINLTMKDTKLYIPVLTLSTKDNQRLSKVFISKMIILKDLMAKSII